MSSQHKNLSSIPDLACQWNFSRNNVSIDKYSIGSIKKAWWICDKGHEWEAQINQRVRGSKCPYCAGRKAIIGETDLKTTHPNIALQFHPTKNNSVKVEELSAGSHKKIWWQCDKGHEWQALVYVRTRGSQCPYCSGIKSWEDEGKISEYLLKECCYNEKAYITLREYSKDSKKVLNWHCKKGHIWQAPICFRENGYNCPSCIIEKYGTIEKILDAYPLLKSQYDFLNNMLITENVRKSLNWKCERGHHWKCNIKARLAGYGCPYCEGRWAIKGVNDLTTTHPELCKEWNYQKNTCTPDYFLATSKRSVEWKCKQNHTWRTSIYARAITGAKCPYCIGKKLNIKEEDISKLYSSLEAREEWDYEALALLSQDIF